MIGKKAILWTALMCVLRLGALGQVAWRDTSMLQRDIEEIAARYGQPTYDWALVDVQTPVLTMGGNSSPKLPRRRVGSIGKVIVAIGIMKLVDAGMLQLDDPVAQYLPDLPLENPWADTDPVRVVHLLEHTSGLDDMHFNEYYAMAPDINLEMALAHNPHSKRIRWRPGTCTAYSNVGYAIAARLIEVLTQQSADRWLHDEVFFPLGMTGSFFENWHTKADALVNDAAPGRKGNQDIGPFQYHYLYYPALGMFSTFEDMSRLVRFMIGDGTIAGKRLLSEASMQRMFRHESTPAAQAQWLQGLRGLGFSLWGPVGDPAVRAAGFVDGYIAQLCFLPSRGKGWLLLSTATDDDAAYIAEVSNRLDRTLPPQSWDATAIAPRQPEADPPMGHYRYVSRRNELMAFHDDMFAGIDLRTNEGGSTPYAIEPWVGEYVPINVIGNSFGDWDEAVGVIALAGKSSEGKDFLLIGDKYYEKTDSPWPGIFRIAQLIYAWLAYVGLAILLILFVGRLLKRAFAMGALPTAVWANLPFWCGLIGFSILQSDRVYDLGRLSGLSIGLCLLSLMLPVASVLGSWSWFRWKAQGMGKFWKMLLIPLIISNLSLSGYLIAYGLLPFAAWWY